MIRTKRTLLSLALAAAAATTSVAHADDGFKLSEKLAVSGFIDMSYTNTDADGSGSSQSSGLDQFELNLLYGFDDKLSAQVDLEYQDNGTGEEVDIEQAFINYAVSSELNVKAGRFLSYSGWETEEPTGLFQYSGTGYAKYFYGGYQQGVSANYSGNGFALAASVVNDLGDLEGEARDTEEAGLELMAALMPTDAITVKAFYMTDELAGTDETTEMFNVWGSYSAGPLTLAAEMNTSENTAAAGAGVDADGYLLMANYAFDSFALTLRYHAWELEDDAGMTLEDMSGLTIAPSFNLTENLLIVLEYRMDEDKLSGTDINTFAVEALVTF